jgi:hypothetical protein
MLAAAACAGSRSPATSVAPGRECTVVPSAPTTIDSATIVLTSAIDPSRVTRPSTWGERFLFELVSDTLHTDCAGKPLGSGTYRVATNRASTLLLEPLAGGPRLVIRFASEADARDLIDAGVDLLLTESPALATYAATRPDVVSVPLPWDRTWVFLTALQGGLGIDSSSTVRSGLARDVVRADARVADGPYWWSDIAACGVATTPGNTPASPRSSRVVYPRDEPIARSLAERLVALTGAGTTAVALSPNAFAAALTTGTELGYVMPLPRKTLDRCQTVRELLTAAPWLGHVPNVPTAIDPLIDTRLTAVVRRNRLNLTFAFDSTVTITPPRP